MGRGPAHAMNIPHDTFPPLFAVRMFHAGPGFRFGTRFGTGACGVTKLNELEQSHAALLGALTFAGIHITTLNRGQRNSPELKLLRRVVRKARVVAEQYDPALGPRAQGSNWAK